MNEQCCFRPKITITEPICISFAERASHIALLADLAHLRRNEV